jgi:hypothetical protein
MPDRYVIQSQFFSLIITAVAIADVLSTPPVMLAFHYSLRLRGGIYDPWELSRSCDIKPQGNATEDILNDWTLENETALLKQCEEELDRHWQRQRSVLSHLRNGPPLKRLLT